MHVIPHYNLFVGGMDGTTTQKTDYQKIDGGPEIMNEQALNRVSMHSNKVIYVQFGISIERLMIHVFNLLL